MERIIHKSMEKWTEEKRENQLSGGRGGGGEVIENRAVAYHLIWQINTVYRAIIPLRLEQNAWGLEDVGFQEKREIQFRKTSRQIKGMNIWKIEGNQNIQEI